MAGCSFCINYSNRGHRAPFRSSDVPLKVQVERKEFSCSWKKKVWRFMKICIVVCWTFFFKCVNTLLILRAHNAAVFHFAEALTLLFSQKKFHRMFDNVRISNRTIAQLQAASLAACCTGSNVHDTKSTFQRITHKRPLQINCTIITNMLYAIVRHVLYVSPKFWYRQLFVSSSMSRPRSLLPFPLKHWPPNTLFPKLKRNMWLKYEIKI